MQTSSSAESSLSSGSAHTGVSSFSEREGPKPLIERKDIEAFIRIQAKLAGYDNINIIDFFNGPPNKHLSTLFPCTDSVSIRITPDNVDAEMTDYLDFVDPSTGEPIQGGSGLELFAVGPRGKNKLLPIDDGLYSIRARSRYEVLTKGEGRLVAVVSAKISYSYDVHLE